GWPVRRGHRSTLRRTGRRPRSGRRRAGCGASWFSLQGMVDVSCGVGGCRVGSTASEVVDVDGRGPWTPLAVGPSPDLHLVVGTEAEAGGLDPPTVRLAVDHRPVVGEAALAEHDVHEDLVAVGAGHRGPGEVSVGVAAA